MKKPKRLWTNKRGISSLFIGIYLALLTVVLLTTLFIGLSVSNASITSALRVEQDRTQEKILITGPNALIINSTSGTVDSLLVKNMGAITARIRSLYIAGRFVCDPSNSSTDSYITPQGSMWIDLTKTNPRISLNNPDAMNGLWTVTTQRGTKSSETGADLWLGSPMNSTDPNKFYFGPLLLFYNMFHWSSNGGSTWNNGWAIPQNTGNVIWRILVANIDNRQINLESTSSFALVQNSQQQQKTITWGIGPSNLNPPNLKLKPGHYYFLYFSVKQGSTNINELYTPNPICSNFLTFIGKFVEPDSSLTMFGQTIPFEAVLITG